MQEPIQPQPAACTFEGVVSSGGPPGNLIMILNESHILRAGGEEKKIVADLCWRQKKQKVAVGKKALSPLSLPAPPVYKVLFYWP